MRYLLSIAGKNISRNKLRTAVSIAAIAMSVALIVILRGFIMGIWDSMISLHVDYDSGHIKVVDAEYPKKARLLTLNDSVDGFQGSGVTAMAAELEKLPQVTRVVERLRFGAATSTQDELRGLLGWGVNSDDELAFTDLKRYLVGKMVSPDKKEIVLGANLLKELNLELGDKITLLFTTSFGSFKGATFSIVGQIESQIKLLDENVFFIPLSVAQRLLEMPDMVTEMLLVTPDISRVNDYLPFVKDVFHEKDPSGQYLVLPWYKTNPLMEMLPLFDNIYNFIYIMLVLLASFVVFNTMMMIVKERTREIGMMTALGLNSRGILFMFLMEGMIFGIIGSLSGVIFGGITNKILSVVGIDFSEALAGLGDEFLLQPVFYPVFTFSNLIFCFVIGVVVTTITCILPARRAAKLEPTEALRR